MGCFGDFRFPLRQFPAAKQQCKCHRYTPQTGQSHLPVIYKEDDRYDRRGDKGTVQIPQTMGPDMLQTVHITHDRFRQISQIPLTEIAQRQFPQTFRETDAHVFHFSVNQAIGRLILLQMCKKGQNEKNQDKDQDRDSIWQRSSIRQRVHIAVHHECKDPHAAHYNEICNNRPKSPLFCVFDSLIRKGISPLKIFAEHLIFPPLQWKCAI